MVHLWRAATPRTGHHGSFAVARRIPKRHGSRVDQLRFFVWQFSSLWIPGYQACPKPRLGVRNLSHMERLREKLVRKQCSRLHLHRLDRVARCWPMFAFSKSISSFLLSAEFQKSSFFVAMMSQIPPTHFITSPYLHLLSFSSNQSSTPSTEPDDFE